MGEKNPKWLSDDYVKFIRFAQLKMDAVEEGVVGIIANHSWLDNPTFRGMRQSLMRSFEQIYVVDLHGNAKKKEMAPDGSKDENVFDIEQGVAISLFVKRAGLERGVWRGDLWGRRLSKYEATAQASLMSVPWQSLRPTRSFYLFAKQDADLHRIYETYIKLSELCPTNVLGFQTHRDAFAISFSDSEMRRKLNDLADGALSDDELMRRYGLRSNRDWSLSIARVLAREGKATKPQLVAYRPFDDRWSEFSDLTMDYPRRELLNNVAGRDNVCILVPRQIGIVQWRHAFVACLPAESCLVSTDTKSQNYVFPIRTYRNGTDTVENLSLDFRASIEERFEHHYDPEEIFGYIYAVLYAPIYRSRYAEFLRIDFPRIPLPERSAHFEALSKLGWELVQVHLLREATDFKLAVYHGKGGHEVEAVRYSEIEQAIWINKDQCFKPVPRNVWEFHIGGYQVLEKYLKSRKGRKLSLAEIDHVAVIAGALAFTIEQMARIDNAYRTAFPAVDNSD